MELEQAQQTTYRESQTSNINTKLIVKGYEFNQGVEYKKIIDSYETTGIQSIYLTQAIEAVNKMLYEKGPEGEQCTIYLGISSSVICSGMREIITYLCKHKLIHAICTTGRAMEYDIMKCFGDFEQGDFDYKLEDLEKQDKLPIGNIYIKKETIEKFENFLNEIFDDQLKEKETLIPSFLSQKMGQKINNEESFQYWCQKNDIPVYAPGLVDSTIGDVLYKRHQKEKQNPKIDVVKDIRHLNGSTIHKKLTGMIILGSGVIKHHLFNANMMRNGAEYVVLINTGCEYDCSDAGADLTEAITWKKVRDNGMMIKIHSEVSHVFPLLVSQTFYPYQRQNQKKLVQLIYY